MNPVLREVGPKCAGNWYLYTPVVLYMGGCMTCGET